MRKKSKLTYGVIGLGRFGMALAVTLAESDNDVIVMDREESSIREMRNYTDYAFVTNDLSMEALREAGIHNCDVVIVCIGEKVDVSVLTTMSVIEMGVPRVIAKALSPEQGAVLKKLGAEVVYPERDMALRLGRRLLSGSRSTVRSGTPRSFSAAPPAACWRWCCWIHFFQDGSSPDSGCRRILWSV